MDNLIFSLSHDLSTYRVLYCTRFCPQDQSSCIQVLNRVRRTLCTPKYSVSRFSILSHDCCSEHTHCGCSTPEIKCHIVPNFNISKDIRKFTVLICIITKILFYFKKLDGLSLESFIIQLSIVKFLIPH